MFTRTNNRLDEGLFQVEQPPRRLPLLFWAPMPSLPSALRDFCISAMPRHSRENRALISNAPEEKLSTCSRRWQLLAASRSVMRIFRAQSDYPFVVSFHRRWHLMWTTDLYDSRVLDGHLSSQSRPLFSSYWRARATDLLSPINGEVIILQTLRG